MGQGSCVTPDDWWCSWTDDSQARYNAHSLEELLWRYLIRHAESITCERQFWIFVELLRDTLPRTIKELIHLHRWELVVNDGLGVVYVDCHMDELNHNLFADEGEVAQYQVILFLNPSITYSIYWL